MKARRTSPVKRLRYHLVNCYYCCYHCYYGLCGYGRKLGDALRRKSAEAPGRPDTFTRRVTGSRLAVVFRTRSSARREQFDEKWSGQKKPCA